MTEKSAQRYAIRFRLSELISWRNAQRFSFFLLILSGQRRASCVAECINVAPVGDDLACLPGRPVESPRRGRHSSVTIRETSMHRRRRGIPTLCVHFITV